VGGGDYHTYALKYDSAQGDAALWVDGVPRIDHFTGRPAESAPHVSFGSQFGTEGHVTFHSVALSTASSGGCGAGSPCCGDGVRDFSTEECDPGNPAGNLLCTSSCKVDDFLVVAPVVLPPSAPPTLRPNRSLGKGRHPIASGGTTFGVAFSQEAPSPASVRLQVISSAGQRSANVDLGEGVALLQSNPVVAALPAGLFAVAWNDFGKDGDELGVALRLVDKNSPILPDLQHANTTVKFSQHDPDIVWTEKQELVVAWVDGSNAQTGPDVRYRIFNGALGPCTEELTLADLVDTEGDVALAPLGTNWAAAWRAGKDGLETIRIRADVSPAGAPSACNRQPKDPPPTIVDWSVGPFLPGPADDKPALAELDATHLLLVYTEGTDPAGTSVANVPALRAAVLDTAHPGQVPGLPVYPRPPQGQAANPIGQSHPNAVRAGNRMFIAWRSDSILGDAHAEDLWIKPVKLSTTHALLDLSAVDAALPRHGEHQLGDQRNVALCEFSPNMQESPLVVGWDDLGTTFGAGEGQGDVVAQVVPMPLPLATPVCTGDLNTDRDNCGKCGHSCLGGTCAAGQCQPVALATGMPSLMGVVVVGGDVYATYQPQFDAPPGQNQPTGALVRISPDGTKTFLENGVLASPSALWFDETTYSFIWPDFLNWNVGTRRLQAPSGSITTLFSNHLNFPFGLVTTRDTIYLSNWGYVEPGHLLDTMEKRPRSDLTQFESFQLTTSVPQENQPFHASHFDVDANYLYWTESQTGLVVRRPLGVPWSSGPSKEVITTVNANARGLAVDGATIYFSTYGDLGPSASPPGRVYRTDNQPGATPVFLTTLPGNLEDVAVDAKAIYIAGRTSGTIWKLAK
jgi:hypothetical protein